MNIVKTAHYRIQDFLKVLADGGLIVFPTDTVYGALVDATNDRGVKKLIDFKSRPPGKPISVFIKDLTMLSSNVHVDKHMMLLKELLPGPFTVILPSRHRVSPLLESEKDTLGVRIPRYKLINDLVVAFGKPITATSANLSGRSAHYQISSLLSELPQYKKDLIDQVLDVGKLPRNKPSTIIDLTGTQLKILRQGDIVSRRAKTFVSSSPNQTEKIARYILEGKMPTLKNMPLVFVIRGDLGVGKTVFMKGIGGVLGIKSIISPTYVVYYEYEFGRNRRLVHIDLYNIDDKEEFKHLGIERYLRQGNILGIEWGEKAGEIIESLKSKGHVVYVDMKYIDAKTREITISH